MVVYVIGPSGVGKTSCASRASEALEIECVHLDRLASGNQFNWSVCGSLLAGLEHERAGSGSSCLVDVGAGTQCLPELQHYLGTRPNRVILVWGPDLEVLQRNPMGPSRALEEFRQMEYISRESLYSLANHRIEVGGLPEIGAQQKFVAYLMEYFGAHERPARETSRDLLM